MAISVNWGTRVVYVPQADLTPLGGSLYELDIDVFRLALIALSDDEAGMPYPDTHVHNTEVVLGGVTYAQIVEMINSFTVEFENGSYGVNMVGANSNIADVLVLNSVSTRSNNSAGLVVVTSQDSGLTLAQFIALK